MGPVRISRFAAAALSCAAVLTVGCADAPITAADLQADGQLREHAGTQQSVHAARSSKNSRAQRAERLRVNGLLAAQPDGPLEDATRFSTEHEAIYLHLRADDIAEPRPVTFVWTHGEDSRETMGFLQPAETLSAAASLPLTRPLVRLSEAELAELGLKPGKQPEFDPLSMAGEWTVEVYSIDANGRSLVFERSFDVLPAEQFEQLALAAAAEAELEAK